jgi:hypothetical protein
MFAFFRKKSIVWTAERQLEALAECGIRPKPGISGKELLKFRPEAYMEKPYLLVLIALGGETSSMEPVSDVVWHLHPDCIRRTGDYVRIARRMQILAGGHLPMDDLQDELDPENSTAWLCFVLDGQSHRWELRLQGGLMDPTVLERFDRLLRSRGSERRYTRLKLGGPDSLIGCLTEQELAKLNERTGLGFGWLQD